MKTKTIVGGVLIVGFSALLFMSFGQQVSGYMNFSEAEAADQTVHVVGTWVENRPTRYDRARNRFSFHMKDEDGNIRQVVYPNPKPTNFEEAEKVVVEGRMAGTRFQADHILVKCPSKYNTVEGLGEREKGGVGR